MKNINVAFIGLGGRGQGNLRTCLRIEGVTFVAVCDLYEDRCDEGAKIIEETAGNVPFKTTDYREILKRDDVDTVIICSDWRSHVKIAIDAMKAGKAVGMEVGGAFDIKECWELVETWEATKMPFMFLENCCYGREELFGRNLARSGKLGEIVHCHGSYGHDLRDEVATGKEKRHYRLNEYLHRNCDNYPTHDLGPIAKILDINRGNRMVRLVTVASKSVGMEDYVNDRKDEIVNKDLIGQKFTQADIVNTLIVCENGSTISLKLDTTLPRNYNREFTVRGTKGMYEQGTHCVFIDGDKENWKCYEYYKDNICNADTEKYAEYMPDIWVNLTEEQKSAGHGGLDYFTFRDFFEKLRDNKPMPVDVYDAAAWMSISILSEESIKGGNIPVEIPDFTKGEYKNRPRLDV